jgi:tetratricopeptide (TPR) repeat protein
MKYVEQYWKLAFGIIGAAIVGGALMAVINGRGTQKELAAQESYFAVEKKLMDLKAKQTPAAGPDGQTAKAEPVDFTQVKKDLEKVMADHPGSIAAQMAALHFAHLLVEEKNFDLALSTLQKVETKKNGLVNTLVQQQIGQLQADKGNCNEAIAAWQKILERKEAAFIHDDLKIQQALCYSKINDLKKAEEILTNLANKGVGDVSASQASKEAEKYLRLLMFKKASGT